MDLDGRDPVVQLLLLRVVVSQLFAMMAKHFALRGLVGDPSLLHLVNRALFLRLAASNIATLNATR